MASIREAMALVALYRACGDETARAHARELVPEIAEFFGGSCPAPAVNVERWLLSATDQEGRPLGRQRVVCSEANLPVYEADFAAQFDLAPAGILVSHERIA